VPSGARLKYRAEFQGRVRNLARNFPRKVGAAAKIEFEIESKESQRRTPKRTRKLERSHKVQEPEVTAAGVKIEIIVGDEETDTYAIPVHENMSAFHPNGQAKFLESTLLESAPFMLRRIAARVQMDSSWLSPRT
jgi:hypothetical protein